MKTATQKPQKKLLQQGDRITGVSRRGTTYTPFLTRAKTMPMQRELYPANWEAIATTVNQPPA